MSPAVNKELAAIIARMLAHLFAAKVLLWKISMGKRLYPCLVLLAIIHKGYAADVMTCSYTTDPAKWSVVVTCVGLFDYNKATCINNMPCQWNDTIFKTSKPGQLSVSTKEQKCEASCRFLTNLPTTSNTPTYSVLLLTTVREVKVELIPPGEPSASDCPTYIDSATTPTVLMCNCSTTSKGVPAGILFWPGYSNTSLLSITKDMDFEFTCVLNWGRRNWTTLYKPRLYPPSSPPVMEGFTSGEVLTVGQSVNLTCTVTGGFPVVAYVEIRCGEVISSLSLVQGQSVYSSLAIAHLTSLHDGLNCSCMGFWEPDPGSYSDVTMIVLGVKAASQHDQETINRLSFAAAIIGPSLLVIVFIIFLIFFIRERKRQKHFPGVA